MASAGDQAGWAQHGDVAAEDRFNDDSEPEEEDIMDEEQHPFPSDEYIALAESLTQLHVANFAPARLTEAVAAAENIFRRGRGRLRQSDLEAVRKLLRDGIAFGFDKVLRDHHLYSCTNHSEEDELFLALRSLVELAALLLSLRAGAAAAPGQAPHGAAPQLLELDGELLQLVTLVGALFARDTPLHEYHSATEAPLYDEEPRPPGSVVWAEPIVSLPRGGGWGRKGRNRADVLDGGDEEEALFEEVEREHEWLVHFLNLFGINNGFNAVYSLLVYFQEAGLSIHMVAALMHVLARAAGVMPPVTLQPFQQLVVQFLQHLEPLAASDDEFLSDQGQDRTYQTFRALLHTAAEVLSARGRGLDADKALVPVQQAFVVRMMDSSNFTKQLSGVRELNCALHRVANLAPGDQKEERVQAFVEWMEEQRLVERMLRANLHQRQYMHLVNAILRDLALLGALTNAHLDQLWGVTEQEGTYEGVKAHVYEGLAELVGAFSAEQIDFLFDKMAARRERSTMDTTKLLDLLARLAHSDVEGSLAIKITGLMWDIVMAPGAARQVVESGAKLLADMANEYRHHHNKAVVMGQLVQRCVHDLKAQRNHVAALKTLMQVVECWSSSYTRKENLVDKLDNQHSLFDLLVDNVAGIAQETRMSISAQQQQQQQQQAAALPPPPGEGVWSYADLVAAYLAALQRLYANSSSYIHARHVDVLWTQLVQGALTRQDMTRAISFFKAAITPREPWVENTEMAALLRCVPALPVANVTKDVFNLTWAMFQQVNHDHLNAQQYSTGSGTKTVYLAKTLDMEDLPHIWALYETCALSGVASMFRNRLLDLYHCNQQWEEPDDPEFRAAFITEVTRRLEEAVAELDQQHQQEQLQQEQHKREQQKQQQPGPALGLAIRRVTRILDAMKHCIDNCQDYVMPPVPAHKLSWQGSPVMVDVHGQQQPRMRVASHSNEYVGSLRSKVARLIQGCASAKRVRLFQGGQEFSDDSLTIGDHDIRSMRQVVTVQLSPVDNQFTLLPDEYRPMWEERSPEWLLSRQPRIFDILFHVVDGPYASQLSSLGLCLLQTMPTSPVLARQVRAGLEQQQQEQQPQQQAGYPQQQQHFQQAGLERVLVGDSSNVDGDNHGSSGGASNGAASGALACPYQVLYRMEVLAALLFPAMQDPEVSPAAAAPEKEGDAELRAAASATAEGGGAATCRALQDRFLSTGGLQVVCGLFDQLASARLGDTELLRELGQVVVVLIHNLMDAATTRAPAGAAVHGAAAGTPAQDAISGVSESVNVGAVLMDPAVPASSVPGGGGDSAMDDAGEAAAVAAASAVQGVARSSTGTPVRLPDAAALMDAERSSQGQGSEVDMGDALRAATPAKGPQALAVCTGDDKQHPPDQRQHQQQQHQQQAPRPPVHPQRAPAQHPAPTHLSQARPSHPVPLSLDARTLCLMSGTLMQLAVCAARVWGAPASAVSPEDTDAPHDVQLAREAMALLQRVLEQRPELLAPLLTPGGGGDALVTDLLLNCYYPVIRSLAEESLGRMCCGGASQPLEWLLSRLAETRPLAAGRPGVTCEYYRLFARVVRALQAGEGAQQAAFACAEGLLADEVAALQALPPAGGDAENVALEGRLRLLLALVTTLDRRSVGSGRDSGLIQLLLSEYLFPMARLAQDERAGRLALLECAGRLRPRCTSAGARRAALELAAELMREGLAPLEEGVRCLEALLAAASPPCGPVMPPKAVRRPGDYCGLRNAGATCYMNAVFQQLYMQPRIRALILGAPEVPEADRAESVFAQLQAVFASMALGLVTHTTPDGFWHAFKDYDGQPIDIREHQDAYEFFTRLQDCVDSHLQSVGCTPALQTVMGGRFAQQVICKGLPYRSEREEEFLQISVDVRGMGSLEKSLENYVQGELMEGDNAYLCEELGRRVPAVKRACIKALPHTLVIHLKRFEFDYHSQTRFKVRDRFEFPEELDLFPFTAAGLAAAEAESAAANGEGGGGGNSSSGHGPSLPRKSSSGASEVAGTAAAAASGGSAARATAARSEYMYDLAGVVVHSGSAFTGHYYSFARERSALAGGAATARRARGWYCFDDKSVRPWDVSNLETDCFGGRASQDYANRGWRPPRNEVDRPHSAYMLFYERCCEWELNAQALQEAEVVQRQQRGKEQEEQQQQQQQHAPGASTSGCSGGGAFVAPWGMPLSLYRQVMLTNITIMMQLHTLDKEFFKFVRQLVENRGDVGGQLSSRKARRRELPPAVAAPVLAAAGAVSGGSCSAMSCDPAPSGTPGTAAGDSGAPISYEQLPSPGPSSRRGEEAEQISVLLTCLALRFQLQLYQRAATALRSDSAIWAEALKALLNAPGPAVGACQLAALQLLQSEPGWMRTLLVLTSDMGARDFVADVVSFLLVHAAQRCNLHAYLSGTSPALAGGSGTEQHQQPQQLQTASALLAPALLKVVEQLVQLLVSTVHAAASDADDQYCVAAVAAVLRDYAVGAPPLHSALLVQRQDLVLCLVEHLSMLYMGGADTMDDFRDDGPAVARLLYTLVSRAGNLERLTLELNASAQVGAGSGRCVASGMQNPYAVTGRLGEPGLFAHAYKRLIDEDAINALMDPVVLCVPEALSLLQILTWENVHATQYVASHLISEAMGMSGAQMLHMLPMIVVPVRDVLSVRDSIALLRAWAALFLRSGGPQPCLIAGLQEGSSQGWGAIRKMLLIACVDAVLQQLTPKELQQLMQAGFSNQASIATMLLHELSTLDSELTSLEAIDHQGSAALIKTHLPAVKFFKNVLMSHLQQLPHIQQFLQQQQQQQQEDEDEEQQQQQKQARVRSSSDSKDPGGAPVLSESAAPL